MIDNYPDIRIYGSDGKRKYFPCQQVESVDWELIERGYYGQCTITMNDDFDSALTFVGNERVEIYIDSVRRYRGYISLIEPNLDTMERKMITAYGLAERLNSIMVTDRIVRDDYPTSCDIRLIAGKVQSQYLQPALPALTAYFEATGFTISPAVFDPGNQSARSVMDSLMDLAARRAIWGIDINPAVSGPEVGTDRIFVRPKGTTVVYKFRIGERVMLYSIPNDYSQIVNTVYLTGGPIEYANLVENPSFELTAFGDEVAGNVVSDFSFEDGIYSLWTLTDSQSLVKNDPNNPDAPKARTGEYCVLLDNTNDYVYQNNCPIYPGKDYHLVCWVYAPEAQTIYAEAAGDITGPYKTITLSDQVFSAQGVGSPWIRVQWDFTAPLQWNLMCSIKIIARNNSANFRVDDISLYSHELAAQPGWTFMPSSGDLAVNEAPRVYWIAAPPAGAQGHNCVQVYDNVQSGKYAYLIQRPGNEISVEEHSTYQLTVGIGTAISTVVRLVLAIRLRTGTVRWMQGSEHTVSGATWTRISFGPTGWRALPGDTSVRVGLAIKGAVNANLLVDAFHFCKCNPGDWPDPYAPPFVSGSNYEVKLATSDSFIQSDAGLPTVVKNSIATYGVREAKESADTVIDLERAQNWAIGYFGIKGQPTCAHRLNLADHRTPIDLDGLIEVTNSGIAPAFPARIKHSLKSDGMLDVDVDLNVERATFEGLLQRVLNKAKA